MTMLARLNPRERVLLLGGGALLLGLALWSYGWQPLVAQRDAQTDRIARYLAVADIARRAGDAAVPVARPAAALPLGPRITQSAQETGITLARLDPDGPRMRITVAQAPYGLLMGWIATLEATQNLRLVLVEMARVTEPGEVSARLVLEDAG